MMRALLRKELLQVRRSRGALVSGTLLPLLLLVILPASQVATLRSVPEAADAQGLLTGFLLPLMVALSGLVVPSVAATYTVVSEHERRTLQLLMALPVQAADLVRAKMLAMLVLAVCVAVPLFAVDGVAVVVLGLGDLAYVLELLVVLLAALACSVCEALVLALLARDLRTTNNLNGALVTPVTLALVGILLGAPPGVRLPLVAGLLALLGGIAYVVAARWLTFERYLA